MLSIFLLSLLLFHPILGISESEANRNAQNAYLQRLLLGNLERYVKIAAAYVLIGGEDSELLEMTISEGKLIAKILSLWNNVSASNVDGDKYAPVPAMLERLFDHLGTFHKVPSGSAEEEVAFIKLKASIQEVLEWLSIIIIDSIENIGIKYAKKTRFDFNSFITKSKDLLVFLAKEIPILLEDDFQDPIREDQIEDALKPGRVEL